MNRCYKCGQFIDITHKHIAKEGERFYHYPSCGDFKFNNDNSLNGQVLRQIVKNSNYTITGELTISINVLRKNIKQIISIIKLFE